MALPSDTVYQFLAKLAAFQPGSIAIRCKGRKDLDYSGLLAAVNYIRQTLHDLGLGRNDRIAILIPNGPEMALTLLGVMGCATCAPLNPKYTATEFEYYLADLKIRAIIARQGIRSAVRDVAEKLDIPLIELSVADQAGIGQIQLSVINGSKAGGSAGAPLGDHGDAVDAEDIALVLHTSGTTSRPKIVPLTQRNVCTSAWNIVETLHLTRHDCCLNIMPLFHIHGIMAGLLSPIMSGGSVICSPGFSDDPFFVSQFLFWVQEMQPSWYTTVPSMHQAILGCTKKYPQLTDQCHLRFIRSSSASLAPRIMLALEEAFKAPVIESYGMTEASHQMASNPLPPALRKPGSVGMAAGPAVAIMDEQGRMLETGEKGEIVIQGTNVMAAYENNDAANKEAFSGEWFRTGDEGYLDDDSYLFITGRLKELINRGGEKISPREIDEVLLEHPAVMQAVAFAFPHPTLGEVPAAAIVLREGQEVESRALQDFVAKKMAAFKVPNPIVFVDEIPKGPTGKPQRIGLGEKLLAAGKV
jgi:acyl-CoA synthetase (AMP-forming)/AMP-acid ligase II